MKRLECLLVAAVLICCSLAMAAENRMEQAMAAFQRGDLASAEATLRAELSQHPNDSDALTVLAVVLDNEKKYADADPPGILIRLSSALPRTASPRVTTRHA